MMIMLFVGTSDSVIGGMEVHGEHFKNYFKRSARLIIVLKSGRLFKILDGNESQCFQTEKDFEDGLKLYSPHVVFFNDCHFVEKLPKLRQIFSNSLLIMRSGGNEFMKAPCHDMSASLIERQHLWSKILNENLNLIIANSTYTWHRMLAIGINPARILIVRGGVDLKSCRENIARRKWLRREFSSFRLATASFGKHKSLIFLQWL